MTKAIRPDMATTPAMATRISTATRMTMTMTMTMSIPVPAWRRGCGTCCDPIRTRPPIRWTR